MRVVLIPVSLIKKTVLEVLHYLRRYWNWWILSGTSRTYEHRLVWTNNNYYYNDNIFRINMITWWLGIIIIYCNPYISQQRPRHDGLFWFVLYSTWFSGLLVLATPAIFCHVPLRLRVYRICIEYYSRITQNSINSEHNDIIIVFQNTRPLKPPELVKNNSKLWTKNKSTK